MRYLLRMRKLLALGVAGIAVVSLTSCGRTSKDFKKAAEKAIEETPDLNKER